LSEFGFTSKALLDSSAVVLLDAAIKGALSLETSALGLLTDCTWISKSIEYD